MRKEPYWLSDEEWDRIEPLLPRGRRGAHRVEVLQVEEGSLYPALQRMLIKGWISGEWGRTAENRRARYYRLTPAGRRQLEREVESYERIARAIARILHGGGRVEP
jgi:DNA-binding PadR family transcriptional regulator